MATLEQILAFAVVLPLGYFFIGISPEVSLLVEHVGHGNVEFSWLFLLALAEDIRILHSESSHEYREKDDLLLLF